MSEPTRTRRTALHRERDRTIDVLCRQFAADTLSLDEFERRVDRAHAARTMEDLASLVSDLPAIRAEDEGGPGEKPASPARSVGTSREPNASRAPAKREPRDTAFLAAVFGGVERAGRWIPPRHLVVVASMGGAELDFREARLPPGETRITVVCLMGGVEIIVPPDLAVDTSGVAVLGGFENRGRTPASADRDAPCLRITGVVIMGGVSIEERLPGETARAAKRRRRDHRSRLRERR